MPYTCPKCGMTSHHPEDERQRYCGNCHEFERDRDVAQRQLRDALARNKLLWRVNEENAKLRVRLSDAKAERDAALARVRELEERAGPTHYMMVHKQMWEQMKERTAALEERVNALKCQLECNWCEGAGRKDGVACDVCEAGQAIAELEKDLEFWKSAEGGGC